MKRYLGALTIAVSLAALMSAAAPPVALRVETAAIRPVGDATLMSVAVQVAPEDRTRLGRDVWVQCELLRAGQRVLRLARALDLDERGQAGFEVTWPPGDYELRVTIEGSGDRAAGLWVGLLSVPAMGPAVPVVVAAPVAASTAATPRPEAPMAADVVPEPAAKPPAMEPAPVAAAAVAAASTTAATVEAAVPPPASQPELAPSGETATERTPETPAAAPPAPVIAATAVAAAAAGATAVEPPPPSRPEVATAAGAVPEPVAESPAAEPAPVAAAAAVATPATAAAVKPAESRPPSEAEVTAPDVAAAEPAAGPQPLTQPAADLPAEARPAPAAEPAPAPVQPATAAGVTGAAWAAANPGMADVTVFVTERNRPILGLGASAFTLRVGGSGATLTAVGDAASAPLNLALVADVAPDAGELADELARQLGRFSLRARNGGDLMVVRTAEPRPEWGAGADDITRWADGAAGGRSDDLAGLVAAAAQAAAGRRGRSVVVVVTDGSDACGKAAWKDAAAAAEAAGVPVFTIGLRDIGFDDQARAGLSKVADATGGRSYFLGSAGMAGMTLDYLGELIDASYALAYRPEAASGGPRELKVEAVNRGWQVHHPRRIP